jgi:prolyl-tRNA editing enzyme YbaK/EbsC (Cys-tRNA(Pro) deacylase)
MEHKPSNNINSSVDNFQKTLMALGYDGRVIEFQESTRTSVEAAERVGCKLGAIVKSLVFRSQVSGKAVLILTSGANRVDEILVSQHLGETIERADPEFVLTKTGFAIGGIPPVGHLQHLDTYIDEDLQNHGIIWAAAGSPNAVFKLTPDQLIKMTGGKVIKVTKPK